MNSFVHLKIDFTCFFRGEGAENRGVVDHYNNQNLQISHLKALGIPKYAYLISFLEQVLMNLNESDWTVWKQAAFAALWLKETSFESHTHARVRVSALLLWEQMCSAYRIMLIFRKVIKICFCLSVKRWWAVVCVLRRSASDWNKRLSVSPVNKWMDLPRWPVFLLCIQYLC